MSSKKICSLVELDRKVGLLQLFTWLYKLLLFLNYLVFRALVILDTDSLSLLHFWLDFLLEHGEGYYISVEAIHCVFDNLFHHFLRCFTFSGSWLQIFGLRNIDARDFIIWKLLTHLYCSLELLHSTIIKFSAVSHRIFHLTLIWHLRCPSLTIIQVTSFIIIIHLDL